MDELDLLIMKLTYFKISGNYYHNNFGYSWNGGFVHSEIADTTIELNGMLRKCYA